MRDIQLSRAVLFVFIACIFTLIINHYMRDSILMFLLFLISAMVGFTMLPHSKEFRKEYQDFTNLSITLLTTFIGVYLAIIFTNKSTERAEITKVISLTKAAQKEIYQKWGSLYNSINDIDSIYRNEPDSTFTNYKHFISEHNIEPYKKPSLSFTLLENELILNYYSQHSIYRLNTLCDNIDDLYKDLNGSYGSLNYFYNSGHDLTICFEAATEILSQQTALLQNKISETEFIHNIEKIDSVLYADINKEDWLLGKYDSNYRPVIDTAKILRKFQ